jgi:hypothetical protein
VSPAISAPPAPSSDSSTSGGSNRKLWAGVLLGVFVLLASASGVLVWGHMRKQQSAQKKKKTRKAKSDEPEQAPPAPSSAAAKPGKNGGPGSGSESNGKPPASTVKKPSTGLKPRPHA